MTTRPSTGRARAPRHWPHRARAAQFAVLTAVLAFAAGTAVLLPTRTEHIAGTALALPGTEQPDVLGDSLSGGQVTDSPGGGATPAAPPDGQQQGQPAPQQQAGQPQHQPAQQQGGQRPGTIRLPQGGTAKLVRQEVGADGTLPVPDGVGKATWWGVGLDAKKGATVFAGHVNWKGVTGPFAELWDAEAGTPVSVIDEQGHEYQFVVSEIITLHKDELPSRAVELFGPRGPHRVVLVTCGGRWVGGQLGYDENRVVIATPRS
ncbi:class F sortase [Goodfellowiella coeruleoviolacea]|uniref:Sortase family protein n=1 Tax=Goodfellowiella coeruleoviolacea TaxID=334858 RepID=A0AAE3KG63_9PSEU|nr:class F sortase [Goodfellowiella coeruleoviolacea]MCP2165710.1 Sortase family protein [Goodfellowiella coeruleoviolacea]